MRSNYFKKTVFPHRYSKLFYDYWMSYTALWSAMIKRLEDEKDVLVLVTGDTGTGKSNLVGNICFKVNNGVGWHYVPMSDFQYFEEVEDVK